MTQLLQLRSRIIKALLQMPLLRLLLHFWMQLSPATRALPMHLWRAIINFKDNGLRQAASLSYYALFSLFPLTLLLVVGVSEIVGPAVAQEQIIQGFRLFLPEETETINLFQESIEQALDQNTSIGLLAAVGLMWSALGLFSNLTASLDAIFQAPASRSMWTQRLLAFVMTVGLILLIIMSFITSGILRLVDLFFLTSPSIWIRIGTLFLPFGLNLVIFVLLFRYVPAREVDWDAVWPAAIFGSVALEVLKAAFAWYLSELATFQIVYGSIFTVIVLMLWAFLVASVFLISAEVCAQVNLWLINHQQQKGTVAVSLITDSGLTQLPAEVPPPV